MLHGKYNEYVPTTQVNDDATTECLAPPDDQQKPIIYRRHLIINTNIQRRF